jgi:hypothetical protein
VQNIFSILSVLLGLTLPAALDLSSAPVAPGGTSTGTPGESHWAFIPPVRPSLPEVKNQRWVRNPIDAFVLARLEREAMTPSPEADRRTLIRRLHLDLVGLPPTPEQVRDFLADHAPNAYEHVVDSLLASSHFGERWARHWLDLARYADTSGYQIDRPRPFAWLYRDWVIDAINADLPFDQFTIEQLAGDLLPNAGIAQRTAAGFHRLTLMNHEDGIDAEEFRCKAKVDRVSTTGTVWLGLTVGCAECHNHKYDPISQREFYQLYAFFNNSEEVDVAVPQASDPARHEQEKSAWTAEQKRLKQLVVSLTKAADSQAGQMKKLLARHRRSEPKNMEAKAESFAERTTPARAAIHIRGDFLRKGDEVGPGTLSILPPLQHRGAAPDRLDLARWIVAPEHPLTARVTVNHLWQHLFGRALVNTPEDFGSRGERPVHSQLLDWLAVTFSSSAVASKVNSSSAMFQPPGLGWSRKAFIRLVVTSATYRQSSGVRPELHERDPDNVLLARQSRFRLESEIIRDVSLAVGGLLNDDIGGPSFRPHLSDDVKELGSAGAFTWTDSEGPEKYRRGLYIFAQRTVPYPTSMTFDQADSSQPCARRDRSNTPLQALTLLNHGLFVECAQGLGTRMLEWPVKEPRRRIEHAFELCLSRRPTPAELTRLERLWDDQLRFARHAPASFLKLAGDSPTTLAAPAEVASAVALSQVLLNLDEFMTRE